MSSGKKSVILWVALVLSLAVVLTIGAQEAEAKDARYWYVKYVQEKRKSVRLVKQRNSLRIAARSTGPLSRSVVQWVRLKNCETKGYHGMRGWRYNGSSGFDGGVQFSPRTWTAYGGRTFSRYAHGATPVQQVAIAQKVLREQGRSAWPHCSKIGAW